MHLNKNIEEALGCVWELRERKIQEAQEVSKRLEAAVGADLYKPLLEGKFIFESAGNVILSKEGEEIARDIIRRQRLAERLLADVLEISGQLMDSAACEFEHIISPEVEESICTLLGHPKLCPHGSAIPPGECCQGKEDVLKSIITTLDKLRQRERAKIVYMLSHAHPELHKLFSLGLVPGSRIKVHQSFPTLVIDIDGQQQVAMDNAVAKNIYVKRL